MVLAKMLSKMVFTSKAVEALAVAVRLGAIHFSGEVDGLLVSA